MSEFKSYYIYREDFFEAIVIGGGTCGLAVSARLCEDYPGSIYTEDEHQRFRWLKQRGNKVNLINHNVSSKTKFKPVPKGSAYTLPKKFHPLEILVLDGVSNKFLGQWDNQFARCQIPYLRSPMFFHPDPVNVDGLVTYSHFVKRDSPKDLMKIENVVGKEYSKHQQKKLLNKNSKKKQFKDPIPTQKFGQFSDKPGLIDINMRDWKDYYRPSTPLFRDFCQDIINRYQLHDVVRKDEVESIEYCFINIIDEGEAGMGFIIKTPSKVFGCKICVLASGHAGEINYPISPFETKSQFPEGSCHTTHIFSGTVKFPHDRIIEKVSQRKGTSIVIVGGGLTSAQMAHVAILSGVEKVYLVLRGALKIKHFDFHLDWVTKYKNVKKSAFYVKDTDEERYDMIQEAREGGSINPEYYKKLKMHIKSGKLEIFKHSTVEDKEWNAESKLWDLTINSRSETKNTIDVSDIFYGTNLSNIDYIYYATGISANIKSLPCLKPIIEAYNIETVKGFPCLTDNLQWNDEIPLFVVGKNASLRMGPSSANLDGARLGAERIGWYIQELKSQGKFDWNSKECKYCSYSYSESVDASDDSLDDKLDKLSTNSDKESEIELTSFETQLKLACGELNWFSLLQEV